MKPRYANPENLKARFLGRLHGKRVFDYPVEVTIGEAASLTQENIYPRGIFHVISDSARAAADFIANHQHLGECACVEIDVWGPKAGLAAKRFWGWDRAIWNRLLAQRENGQLTFQFQTG